MAARLERQEENVVVTYGCKSARGVVGKGVSVPLANMNHSQSTDQYLSFQKLTAYNVVSRMGKTSDKGGQRKW